MTYGREDDPAAQAAHVFACLRQADERGFRTLYVSCPSEEFGVPVSLICAVIHTESGFRTQVLSHAQAYGLMQITEDTFLWAQQRSAEEEALSVESLYDPAVNIRYGVYILSLLRERFADTDTLLAAYNAGAGRVEQWLQDPAYAADGVLRTVPYEETARYVEKVQQAQQCYRRIYGLT